MREDSSLEFDMFEDVRRHLTEMFVREGRELIEAERIALYVVQGAREVPKMLTMVVRGVKSDDEVRAALLKVLDNASALDKAKALILRTEDKVVH